MEVKGQYNLDVECFFALKVDEKTIVFLTSLKKQNNRNLNKKGNQVK